MTDKKKLQLIVRNASTQMSETWGPPAVPSNGHGNGNGNGNGNGHANGNGNGNRTKSRELNERHRMQNALADSERRYRRLFETAKDGILILDATTGQITDSNPFLEVMLGYRHAELLGKTLWEIGPLKDAVASREAFRQLQANDYVRYEDLPLETKMHEHRHVEFVSNVYMVDGTKVIQCNIRAITERKLAEDRERKINDDLLSLVAELQKHEREMILLREKLHEQANHDPLTGLFNRRYLDDSLSRDLSLAWRRGTPLCLVALDIDQFKRFNDTFGHGAGDMALRECARVLSRNLRKCDIACRLGGDEFALVLPDSSLADTRQRLEQICALIGKLDMRYDGQLLGTMTLSVGIAAFPDHALTAPDLLRAADAALYSAKQVGREKIVLFDTAETGEP
jgi:diguanylate cyclase (GGDEF)-like protein/PAS domain S-box-containing protein